MPINRHYEKGSFYKKKNRSGREYNLLLMCLPSSYDPYQQTHLRKNKKNENGKFFVILYYVT